MPYGVTVADVENRWRPLQPAEASVASYIIGDLLNDLALHRPALAILVNGLEASINPEDHAQAEALKRVITKVLAYAVKRILRNPEAMRNMNIGADGSIGIGYDNDLEALQGVELTRDEFADIDAAAGAVGDDLASRTSSIKMQAYPERYAPPDMSILPTP